MVVTTNIAYCLNVTPLWSGRQLQTLRKEYTASIFTVKDPEFEGSMVYVRPVQNFVCCIQFRHILICRPT